jgi:hypothetical protein
VIIYFFRRKARYEQEEKSRPEKTPESSQPNEGKTQKADGGKKIVIIRSGI